MSPERIRLVINQMQHEREQARQIRRIVSHLMMVLNIPEGDHLVMIFGDGHERNNREALETWVKNMLPEIDMDEVEDRLEQLSARLERRIICLGDGQC